MGIIGMGRIGNVHYQNLLTFSDVHVKTICDILVDNSWKEKYTRVPNLVKDYHHVLDDPMIDAVLICTPTDLHPQITIDAARAGKDIFCEKPVGFENKDILEAYKVVNETGVKFEVGFNRRFDKHFDKIVEHRDEGRIGEQQILKITSRDPEPPSLDYVEHSGGIFMDMTIHDFDMARFITGQEIDEVHVFGNVLIDDNIRKFKDIDTAVISLKFTNGMLGVIDNSRKAVYGYDQRIELFGSKGVARAENVLNSETIFVGKDGSLSDTPMYFFLQRYKDAYARELKSFFGAIRGKHPVACNFEDGIRAIRLAEAAKRSLLSGQAEKVAEVE
ncbi:myo-inositol 2-dehydrogenase [Liquorilactobacillus sucicola DSM 21376 = JCM 15457]|uniref:Myo-inositol 2-dehydrogenase n=1 Tax=Liquorilactobacillus sucicola DSM 21376 = JCM 15457 TaxID=1423806 RepID=A0A0R2DRS5_9LACO|nr:myo-inositol 2-dehydrogenase [Liquorilactobacillus sucicola DSM 21376 = JCM 15457]